MEKPAILYPEAALVNEAGRILTSKIGIEDNLKLSFKDRRGFLSRLGMDLTGPGPFRGTSYMPVDSIE